MENQGWKALQGSPTKGSPGKAPGGANPFTSSDYAVQSTYVPPSPANDPFAHLSTGPSSQPAPFSYAPAAAAFPQSGQEPFGAPPPAFSPEVVPAVLPSASQAAASGSSSVLQFQVPSYSQSANLLGGTPLSAPAGGPPDPLAGKFSVFNLRKYRRHFNVDTGEVLGRMRDSVVGAYKPDFLEKVSDNADLFTLKGPVLARYGPFWIATTLVFLSAVAGNYASYISYQKHHSSSETTDAWFYDVDKVGYSAVIFYGYVGVVGLGLWATLKWWFKSEVGLPQVWCTYGYALSLFIPVSIVCVLPYELLRWLLISLATLTSGLFLLLNFRRPIFDVAGARALPVWLAVGGLHLGLGLALKLYFFQYTS